MQPISSLVPRLLRLLPVAALLSPLLSHAQNSASVSALSVPLVLPSALAFDSAGDLFIAEQGTHRILEISASGTLSTIAGNGIQGFSGDGGPATSASLDSPSGLALSSSNILYLSDTHNHRIRAVDLSTGLISTVAGSGLAASTSSSLPALSAGLTLPTALALAPDGTLYIADSGQHRILRFDPVANTVTVYAGNGTQGFSGDGQSATSASLDSPSGLAFDSSGNLYIADTHNQRLRLITKKTGIISTFSGNAGPSTSFSLPRGITVAPSGDVFFTESGNQVLRRIAPDGTLSIVGGDTVQGFAGDGAAASSARLDTPAAAALAPSGALAFVDSHNGRIRELSSDPSAPTIQTIAGIGSAALGRLLLSGPSVVPYGSGQVVATLQSTPSASAAVSLLSNTSSGSVLLGQSSLTSGSASFSLASLPAGPYSLMATFPGDQTHPAAQSTVMPLVVAPLPITVSPASFQVLYGQPLPQLSGVLSGVLPQDSSSVSVTYSSTATPLAPAGTYPVTAALSGAASRNYSLTVSPAAITIARAPALCTVTLLASSAILGQPVTVSSQVSSTTSGSPSGSITLLDNGVLLSSASLSSSGTGSFSLNSLAAGSHLLSCSYSGDSNFLPASSSAVSLLVSPAGSSDFSVSASGPIAQTIAPGGSATYSFSIQQQGTPLSSPINLAASGLPLGASSSFNPAYLPPGTSSFVLTLTAPPASQAFALPLAPRPGPPAFALLLLPAGLLALRPSRRWTRGGPFRMLITAAALLPLLLAIGCGARIYSSGQTAAAPQTYSILVTATATSPTGAALQHSTAISFTVQ